MQIGPEKVGSFRLIRSLPADGEKQKAFDYAPYLPWSESIPDKLRAEHSDREEKKDEKKD